MVITGNAAAAFPQAKPLCAQFCSHLSLLSSPLFIFYSKLAVFFKLICELSCCSFGLRIESTRSKEQHPKLVVPLAVLLSAP